MQIQDDQMTEIAHPDIFSQPIVFITDHEDACLSLGSMPGQSRWGVNRLEEFLGPLVKKGLRSVILFGVPEKKQKVMNGTSLGLARIVPC